MRLGAFLMPSHPPERPIAEGHAEELHQLIVLDALGYEEAWIGEHFTAAWEPSPAPDLLIAEALSRTSAIRLGPLGHLLPYHHPVELAARVAYLDHLAAGRYQFGAGISALPTDHQLFALDASGGTNRRMTFEALEMMTRLWVDGPSDYRGEFWSMGEPDVFMPGLGRPLRPFTSPHPPIAITGMRGGSPNHRLAGEKGYLPVSLSINPAPAATAAHWATVEEGAASTGRTADRRDWRIVRDVYVAPSDEEARDLAINGAMGRCWQEFLLPLYLRLGLGAELAGDPSLSEQDVTLDHLVDRLWLVGSPSTVARRIRDLQTGTGGFGVLLVTCYDMTDEREAWERSLRLLQQEVLPATAMGRGTTTAGSPVAAPIAESLVGARP